MSKLADRDIRSVVKAGQRPLRSRLLLHRPSTTALSNETLALDQQVSVPMLILQVAFSVQDAYLSASTPVQWADGNTSIAVRQCCKDVQHQCSLLQREYATKAAVLPQAVQQRLHNAAVYKGNIVQQCRQCCRHCSEGKMHTVNIASTQRKAIA